MNRERGNTVLLENIYKIDKEINITNEDFHKKKRHIFIITDSGKPVYSRYGEESDLGPVIATFNVILHKLKYLNGKETEAMVKKVENSHTKTILKKYGNLFTLYITKEKSDDDYLVERCLDSLIHQVTCSITGNFKDQLENNPNFNPGNNLPTHYQTLAWTLSASRHSYSGVFNAFMPFLISKNLRKKIKQNLELYQDDGIVFKQVMTPHSVIAWDNSDFDLTPEDINAIFHLTNSKFKMEGVDYIMPYCIPSIAEKGYVNLYYRLIAKDIGVLLIFSNPELVKECVEICHKIEITLEDEGLIENLIKYCQMVPLSPFHFTIKNVEELIILNTETNQYSLLGATVYKKRQNCDKMFLDKISQIYSKYLQMSGGAITTEKGKSMEFEYYEKVDDFFIGILRDKELLIFAKQIRWNTKESLREELKKAVTVVRSDYDNFFIRD